MKKKRAQAAIEFLTTYSWAIMIILLTIGALTYFDIFNTSRFITERCETGAQISCVEAAVTQNNLFYIRLANNHPVDIDIRSIALTGEITGTHSTTQTIGRGATQQIQFTASPQSNTKVKADITIQYQRTGGSGGTYTTTGTLVLKPLPAGLI